jgi:hypothetical protein
MTSFSTRFLSVPAAPRASFSEAMGPAPERHGRNRMIPGGISNVKGTLVAC